MEDKNLYHIFGVSNYKGGELYSHINLTKDKVVRHLFEDYELEYLDYIPENTEDNDRDLVELISDYIDENSSEYVGEDDTVLEIFKSEPESPTLTSVDLDEFIDELAAYYKETYVE